MSPSPVAGSSGRLDDGCGQRIWSGTDDPLDEPSGSAESKINLAHRRGLHNPVADRGDDPFHEAELSG